MKIYNAKNVFEADQIILYLKENGIGAYQMGSGITMHEVSGFGMYGVDIYVEDGKEQQALELIKQLQSA